MIIEGLKFERLQDLITDYERGFAIGYCPELDRYFLFTFVGWIVCYERWYNIEKEDYELYQTDAEAFCNKFKREISQIPEVCFTERFAGSFALRDYDGARDFQKLYSHSNYLNAFQHYRYIDGVFYARIMWDEFGEVLVPPIQAIKQEDGTFRFPLREKCEKILWHDGSFTVCYRLNQ